MFSRLAPNLAHARTDGIAMRTATTATLITMPDVFGTGTAAEIWPCTAVPKTAR